MLNIFLKRLEDQKKANLREPKSIPLTNYLITQDEELPCKANEKDEPISPEQIEHYLKQLESKKNMEELINSITFDSIQNITGWYEQNRGFFDPQQTTALNTLVHTKSLINMGCACKIHVRQQMADDYYKSFFIRNQKTAIISKIKEIAKVETLIFKIKEEEFLRI